MLDVVGLHHIFVYQHLADVLTELLPKIIKKYNPNTKAKDPRIAVDMTQTAIRKYGTRVL